MENNQKVSLSNKRYLESCQNQFPTNQWLVDNWWTVHPGHRSHPMDACFQDVYVFEKIPIPYLQHFGATWFVDPSECINPVMGRVIGKIHGVKLDANDGMVKTTSFDPYFHNRLILQYENDIPLVYAKEVVDEPVKRLSSRVSIRSYDITAESLDFSRSCGMTIDTSEEEWLSYLADAYSLDSGSSRRRRRFGLG